MAIKLYHAKHTRSVRVLWLLEELQLAYELVTVNLAMGNTGGKEYAKINRLQKVPAIEIGGQLLQESTAILEYLAVKNGGSDLLIPSDHQDFGRFLQWLHGGESGFGMYLSLYFGHTMLLPENQRNKDVAIWAEQNLKNMFVQFGEELAENNFIAGNRFTIADISVGFVAYGMALVGKLDEVAPENVQNWWKKLSQRPAFKKSLNY